MCFLHLSRKQANSKHLHDMHRQCLARAIISNRLDYCIAEHYLRDMLPSIDVPASTIPSEFVNEYPLHHPDLSSGNIFVDEGFNISCIIDGAFCSTVPMPILLTTPKLELYAFIYKSKDIIDIPRLFRSARDEDKFRDLAAELKMEDRSVGELAKYENDYFRVMKSSGKEATARKLTLVSELNQGFVADKRLWRWLDKALNDN
ncbi:predicted protein [Sclerotinia sclerotiorum 1980 UF-70]|uniref:Aminoglycoside phosphotransferase domain-containing protein n=1 Tax=Sclerotinia sclerotiorum (strain ATCC 18683 / 1980 / Ss-1) TaxID=665079 RepID=A7E4I4_SCLS1|nr:predicted protein [Sclerotinia sclerotiorum 1980 UF-70]EDN90806.1 predicted protein [Sclerotinia sclerotiorum 1980 UF-70]